MSLALLLNAPIKTEFREAEDFPIADEESSTFDDLLDTVEKFITGTVGDAMLVLDATKTENHTLSTEIPSHTIQLVNEQDKTKKTSTIHDHVYLKPRSLTISGVVSDSPVVYLSGVFNYGALTNLVDAGEMSPTVNAYNTLVDICNRRIVLDVVTSLEYYKNMMIKSITINRSNTTGKALDFTATLEEIGTVSFDPKSKSPDDTWSNVAMGDKVQPIPDLAQVVTGVYFTGKVLGSMLF
ncbi:MAG TPA: hypothetical protein PKW95_20545 [bacterium]|nr:hypothetical protein [bacterium]